MCRYLAALLLNFSVCLCVYPSFFCSQHLQGIYIYILFIIHYDYIQQFLMYCTLQRLNVFKTTRLNLSICVFPKIGVPQNGWFLMENPIKLMIWGYHYFRKHPYVYCISLVSPPYTWTPELPLSPPPPFRHPLDPQGGIFIPFGGGGLLDIVWIWKTPVEIWKRMSLTKRTLNFI